MSAELFNEAETPFNLAGELLDNGITAEGEARVRALAEAEARKAQLLLEDIKLYEKCVLRRARKTHTCRHKTKQNGVRVQCPKRIEPGERYLEYFGESPAYSNGLRFHIECARKEGLIL